MNGIDAIIARLENQRSALDRALAALRDMDGTGAIADATPVVEAVTAATKERKGGMSPEGKARLVAALKKRWAARKAAQAESAVEVEAPAPAKRKNGMTAAGRRRLAEAMKERWAAKRAGSAVKTGGRRKAA